MTSSRTASSAVYSIHGKEKKVRKDRSVFRRAVETDKVAAEVT